MTSNNQIAASNVEVSDKILTVPNVISFVRLCTVPVFLTLLLTGHDIPATVLFALAAGTDWVDGQIARRTNTVSKLGQLLDPTVDRVLMVSGVLSLYAVGRLPLWVIMVVVIRDLFLLAGGAYLLKRWRIRVAVVYSGKVATTLLFVGFAGLLLNYPLVGGLGVCGIAWLPGFNADLCSWGIWFVYVGLIISLITTARYVRTAWVKLQDAKLAAAQAAH